MLKALFFLKILAFSLLPPNFATPTYASAETATGPIESHASECAIDPEKRIRWADFDLSTQGPSDRVYAYRGCSRTLLFAAVAHSNDPESEAFASVSTAISFEPDIVLIEGFPWIAGKSPQQLLDLALQVEGTPADNEAMLAVREASVRGIPFRGAEPSERAIFKNTELAIRDIFGFYILRQLPQQIRSQTFNDLDDPRAQMFIEQFATQVINGAGLEHDALETMDSVDEFRLWFLRTNGTALPATFDGTASAPSSTVPNPLRSNEISDLIADARDHAILENISEAFKSYTNIAVIYGASHHVVQRPALVAVFGQPETLAASQ